MEAFNVELIAGLIVAAICGIVGFLFRKYFYQDELVLPGPPTQIKPDNYSHLNGQWNLYCLTINRTVHSEPFWIHGINEIKILRKNRVSGKTHYMDHPSGVLNYDIHGDIRNGKMILVDSCLQDSSEFACVIFPDLRSNEVFTGIWCGFDGHLHQIAAPAIMSKEALNASKLKDFSISAPMSLVQPNQGYPVFSKAGKIK